MTDYFVLLGQPRRPWIDESTLKQKFLELSASYHPDRVHHLDETERAAAQARYVELNAAYQCLREPRIRLRHLLELERGALSRDVQEIPADLVTVFMSVGQACRSADVLLAEKPKVTSPMLKVQFFERTHAEIEKLQQMLAQLNTSREKLVSELKQLDLGWDAGSSSTQDRAVVLQRLEQLFRLFSYYDRWLEQIRERTTRLSF